MCGLQHLHLGQLNLMSQTVVAHQGRKIEERSTQNLIQILTMWLRLLCISHHFFSEIRVAALLCRVFTKYRLTQALFFKLYNWQSNKMKKLQRTTETSVFLTQWPTTLSTCVRLHLPVKCKFGVIVQVTHKNLM